VNDETVFQHYLYALKQKRLLLRREAAKKLRLHGKVLRREGSSYCPRIYTFWLTAFQWDEIV
jgi:hypothetical protein